MSVYNEQELYEKWVDTKSPKDLEAVINELMPIVNKSVSKWSGGTAPTGNLRIKGRMLAVDAVKSYDPSAGTKLSSWVYTYLNKLNRYVNSYATLSVSEDVSSDYRRYLSAKEALSHELETEPSLSEIADYLMVPEKKIVSLQRTFAPEYQDSTLNTANFVMRESVDDNDLLYAFRNLTPEEQRLVTYKTGWPDGTPLTLKEISGKVGLSVPTLSDRYTEISEKMNRILRR